LIGVSGDWIIKQSSVLDLEVSQHGFLIRYGDRQVFLSDDNGFDSKQGDVQDAETNRVFNLPVAYGCNFSNKTGAKTDGRTRNLIFLYY
jgi:hypothetical protein